MADENTTDEIRRPGGFFTSTAPDKPESIKDYMNRMGKSITQENTKKAISDTKPENTQTKPITFADAIQQAKNTLANINPDAIRNMSESQGIKYAKKSIADMEQKMAQIAMLTGAVSSTDRQESENKQVANTNTSVTNHTNNITQVTTDYLRDIRSSYERIPQWRADLG